MDALDNVYVSGYFGYTVDFDPGSGDETHSAVGGYDVFLSKFTPDGDFTWAKTWGGTGNDGSFEMDMDDVEDIIICGYFNNEVDFDPGSGTDIHTSHGNYDAFICKLDNDGNYDWAQTWGGSSEDICYAIGISKGNNIYGSGYYMGTADFNPGEGGDKHTSNGDKDNFIVHYDYSGSYMWSRVFGGSGEDRAWGIALDKTGKVLVSGIFSNTVDFDPSEGVFEVDSAGSGDAFLGKYSSSGDFIWARSWGANNFDIAWSVVSLSSNDILVNGRFNGTVDFDPCDGVDEHVSMSGSDDCFLIQLTSAGCY